MTRTTEAITISCSTEQRRKLEAIAERYELIWGGKPNISRLIRLIADGDIPIGKIQKRKPVLAAVKRSLIGALNELNNLEPNED